MSQSFNMQDLVVYPAHGVGEIIDEEVQKIGGTEVKVFVISFAKEKMILRVPVHRAKACGLRPLSNDDELGKVFSVLQAKPKSSKGMWSRRAQEYENKINSGNIINIAEVLRDLHKNIKDDRSYSERTIYESALSRLAAEFAAIENIEHDLAIDRLMYMLSEKEAA
jgi:CarD family transcriptional regulator